MLDANPFPICGACGEMHDTEFDCPTERKPAAEKCGFCLKTHQNTGLECMLETPIAA